MGKSHVFAGNPKGRGTDIQGHARKVGNVFQIKSSASTYLVYTPPPARPYQEPPLAVIFLKLA